MEELSGIGVLGYYLNSYEFPESIEADAEGTEIELSTNQRPAR